MRNLRHIGAAIFLTCLLSLSAFASDVNSTPTRDGWMQTPLAGEMHTGIAGEMDTTVAGYMDTPLAGEISCPFTVLLGILQSALF
jgi:hypothetical protein